MSDNRAIGIFDSGLGGLTVVKQIIKRLPLENIVYLGDTARIPYGTRSRDTIIKFSLDDANFLMGKKVKCVIIACNTASAYAADLLKQKLSVPVFDVIAPALKEAKTVSPKGRIGVIGTQGTILSGAYDVPFSVACPLLVPFIEEGEFRSRALKFVLSKYLKRFKNYKIDTLILGCTHYPIIKDLIKRAIGPKVKLVNPEEEVAIEVKNYLAENNMLAARKTQGKREFFITDMTERFLNIGEMFLGQKISNSTKKVDI